MKLYVYVGVIVKLIISYVKILLTKKKDKTPLFCE